MAHYAPIPGAATGPDDREADLAALVAIYLDVTRPLHERRAALVAADAVSVELA